TGKPVVVTFGASKNTSCFPRTQQLFDRVYGMLDRVLEISGNPTPQPRHNIAARGDNCRCHQPFVTGRSTALVFPLETLPLRHRHQITRSPERLGKNRLRRARTSYTTRPATADLDDHVER